MGTKRPQRVSVVAAAETLGITPRAVRYAITRGQMKAEMIGDTYAIEMTEVLRYGYRTTGAASRDTACRAQRAGGSSRSARNTRGR
jgi:hypothetical protein